MGRIGVGIWPGPLGVPSSGWSCDAGSSRRPRVVALAQPDVQCRAQPQVGPNGRRCFPSDTGPSIVAPRQFQLSDPRASGCARNREVGEVLNGWPLETAHDGAGGIKQGAVRDEAFRTAIDVAIVRPRPGRSLHRSQVAYSADEERY